MQRICHIDLWVWPLTEASDAAARTLSDDERARAAKFLRPEDAQTWTAARAGLRQILAAYLAKPPDQLSFDYGVFGRPSLRGTQDLSFNLSHSGGYAALTVAEQLCLGVDIEAPRAIEPEVARIAFSAAEQEELAQLTPELWQEGFYNCWTRKEAVIKAEGTGLSAKLDGFDVTLTPGVPARLTRTERGAASDWQLNAFTLPAGLVGAVAAKTFGAGLQITPRGDPWQ